MSCVNGAKNAGKNLILFALFVEVINVKKLLKEQVIDNVNPKRIRAIVYGD